MAATSSLVASSSSSGATGAGAALFTNTPLEAIPEIVRRTRETFNTSRTIPITWRKKQLSQIIALFENERESILRALSADLRQTTFIAQIAEFDGVLKEARTALAEIDEWTALEPRPIPLTMQPGKGYIVREPLGVVLIIAPWNYPFRLTFMPLVGAIAAGNCAVLKPSEITPNSCAVMARLIPKYLDTSAVQLVLGGAAETGAVLKERFDHIFYTGNGRVGRIVMSAAAAHLTPVTLELGGKSPVVVDRAADLDVAARRIIAGKFMNMGQTCVAPDYVLVDKTVEAALLAKMKSTVEAFYGASGTQQASKDLSRIVNTAHTQRLATALAAHPPADILVGGAVDIKDKWIQPTVVRNVTPESPLMADEIFGPILPVMAVSSTEDAIKFIRSRDKPLALYVFSNDSAVVDRVLRNTSSGGASVNDCVMQTACPDLAFGGVGPSGMGAYNTRATFETFSHRKGVLHKGTLVDPSIRYPPYDDSKLRLFGVLNSLALPRGLPSLKQVGAVAAGVGLFALRSRL